MIVSFGAVLIKIRWYLENLCILFTFRIQMYVKNPYVLEAVVHLWICALGGPRVGAVRVFGKERKG